MKKNETLNDLGEKKVIQLIEDIIYEKTGKNLIKDDAFFVSLKNANASKLEGYDKLILNSDMLVSTTDVPSQMNSYEIGRKAVIMNISDLVVKGVKPLGIIFSFGLPKFMNVELFKELINGIVDYCSLINLDYIGGDLNQTKELIISPTVFGFQNQSKIIHRKGAKEGDYIALNGKFGLTGVGFDILLNKKRDFSKYSSYKRSINSVLRIQLSGYEAIILANNNLATASIDSSDGLAKSLNDLMLSNPNIGFEIVFNETLIDEEAIDYSNEFNVSLEDLVFNAGEEFIHIFTIDPDNYSVASKLVQEHEGNLFLVGKVIAEDKIYVLKEEKKIELKSRGFEHFI